jgi:hypothetical protein
MQNRNACSPALETDSVEIFPAPDTSLTDRHDAAGYRRKADEIRTIVTELTSDEARRALRTIAWEYEILALRAERRTRMAMATIACPATLSVAHRR